MNVSVYGLANGLYTPIVTVSPILKFGIEFAYGYAYVEIEVFEDSLQYRVPFLLTLVLMLYVVLGDRPLIVYDPLEASMSGALCQVEPLSVE